jgi:hypothetical protein
MRIFAVAIVLLSAFGAVAQNAPDSQQAPDQGGRDRARREFQQGNRAGGTIAAIKGDVLTLKTLDGKTMDVKVASDATIRKDGKPAKFADLKVGDPVMVRGDKDSSGAFTARMVMSNPAGLARMREGLGKEFIAGEVKEINGTKLTIDRIDHQTQTIEVDENTSFRKQGESVTLADIKVGDHVIGRGEVKNGVFVPSVLNVGDFPRARNNPPQP